MTPSTLFQSLPDEARCWIYAIDRSLTGAEQQTVLETLETFLENWTSHEQPVLGAATILDDCFLVVAGITAQGTLSGCGIDALTRAVTDITHHVGFTWLSPLLVFYRDAAGRVQSLPRSAFRKRVAEGEVTTDTPVFDLSLTTLGQVREGLLEKAAGQSWHARVFRIPEPAA
ncbi:MAG: hypothetical protein ACE5G0_04310 [Rhodothermales bacterium]